MEINLPQDSVIPLFGIYLKDGKLCHKNTCSTMFIAVLFVISRTYKQSRCPLVEEQIEKMSYICTIEYHSAVKNKDTRKFGGT